VLGDGMCKCLWLGDNDVTLSMVKRAYQNFNTAQIPPRNPCLSIYHKWLSNDSNFQI
jgi:hypothetical protein